MMKTPRSRGERAVQFAPFAALSGFEEVIRKRTVVIAQKRELLPDEKERINRILCSLEIGDTIRVTYYRDRAYITATGILTDLDPICQSITVVKTIILLADLFDVSVI